MPMSLSPLLAPTELARLAQDYRAIRLLDVRTPAEFEAEHIEGAYNVPLDTLAEHGPEIRAGVSGMVVLICRSGQRARKAEAALTAAGMSNLHVLDGGIAAWIAAGLPVRRGMPRMSLERQVRIAAGALVLAGVVLGALAAPVFYALAAFVGAGLVYSGVTDSCGMAYVLARAPWNRAAAAACGVSAPACSVSAPSVKMPDGTAFYSPASGPSSVSAGGASCAAQGKGGGCT